MTGEQRQTLKIAIDARKRALVLEDCGTTASHTNYNRGCRCLACRRAEAAYRAVQRRNQSSVIEKHGRKGYNAGCRCQECRLGHNAYKRDLHARNNPHARPRGPKG